MPGPSLLRKDALHSEGFDSLRKVSVLLDTSSLRHMKSQSALDEFLSTSLLRPLRSEHYPQAIGENHGKNLAGKKRLAL